MFAGDVFRPRLVVVDSRDGLAAQQTLVGFLEGYRAGRYDPSKGRLRQWLFGIASNVIRQARRKPRAVQVADSAGTDFFEKLADDVTLEALWDEEWRTALLAHCLRLVRDEVEEQTYSAFDRFACQGRPAAEVAGELRMSENAVYGCKRRVLERLRELASALEDSW